MGLICLRFPFSGGSRPLKITTENVFKHSTSHPSLPPSHIITKRSFTTIPTSAFSSHISAFTSINPSIPYPRTSVGHSSILSILSRRPPRLLFSLSCHLKRVGLFIRWGLSAKKACMHDIIERKKSVICDTPFCFTLRTLLFSFPSAISVSA
jgi:hypothetical protein